jgi:hypothetical protein
MGHQGLTLGMKNLLGFYTHHVLLPSFVNSSVMKLKEKKKGKPNGSIHSKKERKKEAHKMRTKKPKNL